MRSRSDRPDGGEDRKRGTKAGTHSNFSKC